MSLKVVSLSILVALILSVLATVANLNNLMPQPAAYFVVALLTSLASGLWVNQTKQQPGQAKKPRNKPAAKRAAQEEPRLLNSGNTETGQVKWFSSNKGFGFITRDSGDDIFVHFRSISGKGHRVLREGQRVEFAISEGSKGLQAEEVSILED